MSPGPRPVGIRRRWWSSAAQHTTVKDRPLRRQHTRRSTILLAATVLTALPVLPALADAPDTLTLGIPLEPPGLDPTAGAASAIREVTYANIFQGLTRIS